MSILIQRNYTSFVQALGKQAATNDILGAALAVNVNIPPNYEAVWRDGIRVTLETKNYSRYVYVPYSITLSGLFRRQREVKIAEPFAVETPSEIFLT